MKKPTYYLYQCIQGKFYMVARSKDWQFLENMRLRKNNPLIVKGL